MKKKSLKGRAGRLLLALLVPSFLYIGPMVGDAQAIIGRPLTPLSYAGVARRTTRRTVAATAVAAPYYW